MINVTVVKDNLKLLEKTLNTIKQKQIFIGIPQGTIRTDNGLTNAEMGYLIETGSPFNNIPAQPFLIPAVQSQMKDNEHILETALGDALKLNSNPNEIMDGALNFIGDETVDQVIMYLEKNKVTDKELVSSVSYYIEDTNAS